MLNKLKQILFWFGRLFYKPPPQLPDMTVELLLDIQNGVVELITERMLDGSTMWHLCSVAKPDEPLDAKYGQLALGPIIIGGIDDLNT